MNDFNSEQVEKTLKAVIKIFKKHNIEYRFMGSVLPTALNGKLYRQVNDFDLLADKSKLNIILEEFKKLGFIRKSKNNLRISEQLGLYVFTHPELLEVGFFIVDFGQEETIFISGPLRFIIKKEAAEKTNYTFKGINFWGIPPSVAYLLSSYSKKNPKRKEEFQIYKRNNIKPFLGRPYDTYFMGLRINWLIDFLNFALVVLGKSRVFLGKTYDPWR